MNKLPIFRLKQKNIEIGQHHQYARQILALLKDRYSEAECSLHFQSPLELLISTILSAQCTDERVNKVTPSLFAKYPSADAFADSDVQDIETLIHSTGFYHNKAKNIQGACRMIVSQFKGRIPETMADLTSLPGVGRKTANVVLGNGFGKNEGFVVDTHIFRLSHRMGLAQGTTPEKVEIELMDIFPQEEWCYLSHALIQHGRSFCQARKTNCSECPLTKICPRIGMS